MCEITRQPCRILIQVGLWPEEFYCDSYESKCKVSASIIGFVKKFQFIITDFIFNHRIMFESSNSIQLVVVNSLWFVLLEKLLITSRSKDVAFTVTIPTSVKRRDRIFEHS